MHAIVTGGAGFIGSHLVDALLAEGDEVTVVDHLRRGHRGNLVGAEALGARVEPADVTDLDALVHAFGRADAVYHLAAQIDVRHSVEDPANDALINVGGTAAVLEAACRAGARRLVLASTAAVYGDPDTLPTPERAPLRPLSPYGASKAAAERYLELFSRTRGISTLALRMANVFGPRQDPHGEAGVVSIFSEAAATGAPVAMFGDGSQTRDFVYVGDVVAAFVAAGRSEAIGVLNVSTGRETSLRALVEALGLEAEQLPARSGEVSRSCLDPSAAARVLGWTAATSLHDGLERTVAR